MKIYSLGTSIRTTEEFLGIGRTYDIKVMADMRSFPQRRFAHFNQIELAWQLRRWGIEYLYLGKELGGYRRGWHESYVDTTPYRQGLQKLEKIAGERVGGHPYYRGNEGMVPPIHCSIGSSGDEN